LCQTYNVNKSSTKPQAEPSKFHPFVKKKKPRQATPEEIEKLLGPNWNKG
jgi:hypothetical protein